MSGIYSHAYDGVCMCSRTFYACTYSLFALETRCNVFCLVSYPDNTLAAIFELRLNSDPLQHRWWVYHYLRE